MIKGMKMVLGLILALVAIASVFFFFPKQKYFGCGAICSKEELEATQLEEAHTHCFGIPYKPSIVMDADVMGCYGIFLEW